MSKRTASRNRVSTIRSGHVVAKLQTVGNRRYVTTIAHNGDSETTSKACVDVSQSQVCDRSEIDLSHRELSYRRDVATLLVPAQSCIVRSAKAYLQASGAKLRHWADGTREYALERVPKDMLVPRYCRLIIAIVPAEGTGTDQHLRETRGGHAQRRDYSAKKGPKRTYRVDGAPNGEEVGRPIQGDGELTPLDNREAAREYWH